jgi:hypothetical protein
MPDEKIMIDDWIDELTLEDHFIVYQRACIDLGWSMELKPEGGLIIDGDTDSDEFLEAVENRYKLMHATEILASLAAKGEIVADHVDEDGNIFYVATEEGA